MISEAPRVHKWKPNPGAQLAFCNATEQFPAMVSGLMGGKTWAGARKTIQGHVNYPGSNSLVIEPTYGMISTVAVPELIKGLEELGVAYEYKVALAEIRTPAFGSKIFLRAGIKAERIAGFEVGRVWIDEAARIPDFPEPLRNVWLNCIGRLRSPNVPSDKRQAFLTCTHEGAGTWFYRDWEKSPKPGHKVYRGDTRENPLAADYAKMIEVEYGAELTHQYLRGYAVESGLSCLSWESIEAAQDPDCPVEVDFEALAKLSTRYRIFAGMDIGRSKSLTVIWLLVKDARAPQYRTAGLIVLRSVEFAEQTEWIRRIMALKRLERLSIDATYNPQTAEDAVREYGSRVQPVVFTPLTKMEIISRLMKEFPTGNIPIPEDDDIAMDLFSVKRTASASGVVKYHAPFSIDGHADRFVALALAVNSITPDAMPFSILAGDDAGVESAGLL